MLWKLTLKNSSLSWFLNSSISWFLIIVSGLCGSDRHQGIRDGRQIHVSVCVWGETYSDTGCRWKGHRRGVFSICTAALLPLGASEQEALLQPPRWPGRWPAQWPLLLLPRGDGRPEGDLTAAPWPSSVGVGGLWMALRHEAIAC